MAKGSDTYGSAQEAPAKPIVPTIAVTEPAKLTTRRRDIFILGIGGSVRVRLANS